MGQEIQLLNIEATTLSRLSLTLEHDDGIFSSDLHAKILDWSELAPASPWKQQICQDSTKFEVVLKQTEGVKLRIISFHSPATCLPLKASAADFQALTKAYKINREFVDTLLAFGSFPDPANGHTSTPTVSRTTESASFETWYRLQYPEKNNRSSTNPWSIRHTGVYHQYNHLSNSTLIVLIHPCRDTILESALFDEASEAGKSIRNSLIRDPLSLHQALCDAYLPNWSPCIRHQSKAQEQINDDVQTSDLRAGSLESDFLLTQKLRFLKSTSLTNRMLCQDNIAVLNELAKLFHGPSQQLWITTNKAKALARCDSLLLLQERIQNDIDLVGMSNVYDEPANILTKLEHAANQRDSRINHRNQTIAVRLNETLLNLTYNTVDDSATIKIITIFTLIFLPGSFIAAIFGSNFFGYEDRQSNLPSQDGSSEIWSGLKMGQNFWIFVAIWLPVTAIVLLIYLGVTWRRRNMVRLRRMSQKRGDGDIEV